MKSSQSSSLETRAASASAAASFISSVMRVARASRAPLKMPGKATTLLIWFGKSERPVPTTRAPASRATSGMISGTGLAMAKTAASGAMAATISPVTMFGADTPTKTSAPLSASASVPSTSSRFVHCSISRWASVAPSVRELMMPLISQSTRCLIPQRSSSFDMAMPAEPAPFTTTRTSSRRLPVRRSALMTPQSTTIAVPC